MNREYYRQRAPRLESRTFAGFESIKPAFRPDKACGQWVMRPEYVDDYLRWMRRWLNSRVGRQWVLIWRHSGNRLDQLTRWSRMSGASPRSCDAADFLSEIQLPPTPNIRRRLDDIQRTDLAATLTRWRDTTIGRSVIGCWRRSYSIFGNIQRWLNRDYPPSAAGVIAFLIETQSHQFVPINPE